MLTKGVNGVCRTQGTCPAFTGVSGVQFRRGFHCRSHATAPGLGGLATPGFQTKHFLGISALRELKKKKALNWNKAEYFLNPQVSRGAVAEAPGGAVGRGLCLGLGRKKRGHGEGEKQELFLRENLQGNGFEELRRAEAPNPGRVSSLEMKTWAAPAVAASLPAPSRARGLSAVSSPGLDTFRDAKSIFCMAGFIYCHSQRRVIAHPAPLSSGVVTTGKGTSIALARRAREHCREPCGDTGR